MTKGDGKPCKKCGTSEWDKRGNCKQCTRNRANQRYRDNPGEIQKQSRQWRINNPEKKQENNKRWAEDNPEKVREYSRRYAKNNPEKKREAGRRWVKVNPEKVSAKYHRRRTRKTKAGGSYTAAEWKTLCKQYDNRCLCCGKKTKLTADHVIPVIDGGNSDISNIQPLCKPCNSRKGTSAIDYRARPGILRWIQDRLFD